MRLRRVLPPRPFRLRRLYRLVARPLLHSANLVAGWALEVIIRYYASVALPSLSTADYAATSKEVLDSLAVSKRLATQSDRGPRKRAMATVGIPDVTNMWQKKYELYTGSTDNMEVLQAQGELTRVSMRSASAGSSRSPWKASFVTVFLLALR